MPRLPMMQVSVPALTGMNKTWQQIIKCVFVEVAAVVFPNKMLNN